MCWLCSSFAASTLKAVVRHIGAVHARNSNFHVLCGIQGCVRTYAKFHSFKKHVYRHHREHLNSSNPQNTGASGSISTQDDEDELGFLNPDSLATTGYDYTEQAALFLLKARHVHKISQLSLDDLLADISSMIADRVQYIQNKVQQQLPSTLSTSSVHFHLII